MISPGEIKVLFIGNITGAATHKPDIELIRGLNGKGVRVDAMIPADLTATKVLTDSGIRVIPTILDRKFNPGTIRQIRKQIVHGKYHIIHLLNTRAIVNGSFAALGLPVKAIAYRGATGVYWHDPTAWFSHLNPRIDYIICNSFYVQEHLQRHLLFHPEKAVMIHKGMDPEWFKGVKPISRKELGIPDDSLIAGCVANVRRIKGVHVLLESMRYINPELNLHFILAGNGIDSPGNLKILKSGKFSNRVHILGFRKDVYELVSACDIYIQPSLSESLSRSVMEAMCLRVPCIVSNVGGLIELIENGKSGLVTGAGDSRSLAAAVEKLANDAGLRKIFAEEAFRRINEMFSMQNMVQNTLDFYKKILS